MEFFKKVKNSIYGPGYYQEVSLKPFSYSFKYYFLLALALSLIIVVFLSFTAIPKIQSFADYATSKAVELYPQELKIEIKNGQAQSNVPEPYFIKIPDELKTKESAEINNKKLSEFENLFVVDTKDNFSLEAFNSYKTFALLTKDSIVYYNKDGITIQQLDKVGDFSIDKGKIASLVGKIKPFIKFIYPLFILLIYFISLLVFAFQLVYLFFGALFVWLVARIKKVNIGYMKSYQLGLHLMTLVIIIGAIFFMFGIQSPFIFFFTLVLVIMAAINLKSASIKNEDSLVKRPEAGQVSRLLLVLAIIVFVAIIITYLIMRAAQAPTPPPKPTPTSVPMPVYEQKIGDIKFVFEQARDMGDVLKGSQSRNPTWQKDLSTTEKFIKVTIGAQNMGDQNIKEQVWDLGPIVDSENRQFTPLQYTADPWLPDPNLCGALLKPAFDPIPCVKIYEVSKIAKGLKIQVISNKKVGNEYVNDQKESALIDLIVTQ